jgi:hypothetical protein
MQSVCNNELFTASADFDEKVILQLILENKEWDSVDWTDLAQDRVKWRVLVKTVMNIRFHRRWRHL